MPKLLKTTHEVRDFTSLYNLVNRRIGFVPTMGALHEGHLELGRRAGAECDCVIYSVFVNPIQFGPKEDLSRYPRDIQGDLEKLDSIGVDAVFVPDEKVMYPEGFGTFIDIGQTGSVLCGKSRPGHFRGVATVVSKLFNIVSCDQAYFGMKDYQQLVVLKKMVRDLNFPVEIIGVEIVREKDGLAMSSRNVYLSKKERAAATVIFRSLENARKNFGSFKNPAQIEQAVLSMIKEEELAIPEYISVRNASDLSEIRDIRKEKAVLLAAVKFGNTRLIDNIVLN